MSKTTNDTLRIIGIVIALASLSGIVRPLFSLFSHAPVVFWFFGIIPDGIGPLIIWIVLLIVGLVLIGKTKEIKDDAGNTH
ncbi:hypothetical protein EPA93_04630 [Ktedonosporobacter rubrisoli]|uniref:Uncharacterized protein n=1 Tax=Ktedonosporobacter rubrisoli TaxID=2509675 RepID=A0A4V0YY83_KTERU|nr:hypothetical protein [Ktedonosporobacter rubrisoli]QBD75321.1 hypothetical protein EPA93_04630 [Ktedonosporobacter rubrisoli]